MQKMLHNMVCGTAEAAHDRILEFSTALTGGLSLTPTVDLLEDPPVPASPAAPCPPGDGDRSLGRGVLVGRGVGAGVAKAVADGDRSLGIGSRSPRSAISRPRPGGHLPARAARA